MSPELERTTRRERTQLNNSTNAARERTRTRHTHHKFCGNYLPRSAGKLAAGKHPNRANSIDWREKERPNPNPEAKRDEEVAKPRQVRTKEKKSFTYSPETVHGRRGRPPGRRGAVKTTLVGDSRP
ncbi:hypothetical protein AALP_AA8G245200 [Arabis alpina]|uniref:Uncharacterized protein n=1 Tax=Arabis alpina TaxID=50452 RepID=A0A087G960_ARAAL|nr:hypothetical protein AALP_AA8G245200 [Arabis alpina]